MKAVSLNKNKGSMLSGNPMREIVVFSIPIILGLIFQEMYNMVDSIVVGNFVGAGALAAVGSSATVCSCLLWFFSGFNSGASIVISQQFGAGAEKDIKKTMATMLITNAAITFVLVAVFYPLIPAVTRAINIPDEIIADSVAYLRIYSLGLIFMTLYNFLASTLRALGDSVKPFLILVFSSVVNTVLDLAFVIALGFGVRGAAFATVMSQGLSVLICVLYARKGNTGRYFHFAKGEFTFSREMLGHIMRMGLPNAIQGGVSHVGFIVIQGIVNTIGMASIAAYAAGNKLENFAMILVSGLNQSLGVYTAQNIGAGSSERASRGLRDTVISVSVLSVLCGGILIAARSTLIGLFVDNAETGVILAGSEYIKAFAGFLIFHGITQALVAYMRSCGDSYAAMSVTIVELAVRTASTYILCIIMAIGFRGCGYAAGIGWIVAGILALARFLSGKWKNKAIVFRAPGET